VKIYTKTGDAGETSLFDGTRVSKTDARVAAYGDVDELQASVGLAIASGLDRQLSDMCLQIQRDLFALGARLADPAHKIAGRVKKAIVTEDSVATLEGWIDSFDTEVPALRHFILSGGSPEGAALHLARAVCRRAERAVIGLGSDAVEPLVVIYLNRLSDLLFVMARAANHRKGMPEVEW
jgi:cob(I)alamin adenosyltransferase